MTKYVYAWSELWRERSTILDQELRELAQWLHNAEIDPDFDPEQHVYTHSNGDRWIFLPELSRGQLFAATLILSSSELSVDDRPVRFDRPPNALEQLDHADRI
jgi:hypothetical protein